MDIQFPQQKNPFPKTMLRALAACLLALAIGLFLGNALGAFFGTDESVLVTSAYTDRMSAIRTVFTDGDQLDSFARTALKFREMEGLKLCTSRNRDGVQALWEGEWTDAFDLLQDEELRLSLLELMHTEDALYGVETAGGSPIDDVRLYNISVEDGVVLYYLYYDEAGFAGVAYDPGGTVLGEEKWTLPLTQTQAGVPEWYIIYNMGDS